MRMIFVRHGEPDYRRDCLTEEGKRQAEACARRLVKEGISAIYTSPCGRASQTAAATARALGLPVVVLDYMHEISWGGAGIPLEGHPWTLADAMIDEEDFDFHGGDWRAHRYFEGNAATEYYDRIAKAFDGLLASRGYKHAGTRFFCEGGKDETIALFSHGGSGACALAHVLALPFPYVASVMPYGFTSVTILNFPVREGEFVHPRLELFNDCAHIESAARLVIQEAPDELG